MTWLHLYLDFMVFLFGAVVGSFLNVCVHRMPREESIVSPPSHCPHCHEHIRWTDNIPLVSYAVLRGKCRHCRAPISPRYVLIELLTAILFLMLWLKLTPWDGPFEVINFARIPIYWFVIGGLIVATFIDLEHYIIPNEITMGGVVVGCFCSIAVPSLQHTNSHWKAAGLSFVGIVTGGFILFLIAEMGKLMFGKLRVPLPPDATIVIGDGKLKLPDEEIAWSDLFSRESDKMQFTAKTLKIADKQLVDATVVVRQDSITVNGEPHPLTSGVVVEATTSEIVIPREAMGFGDVKLLAAIGAFLGWEATVFVVFLSSMAGSLVGLTLIAVGKRDLQGRIPFGPYIALGAVIWLFAQDQLLGIMSTYMVNVKELLMMLLRRG